MNQCKNCKYWIIDKEDNYNQIVFPPNPKDQYLLCQTEEEVMQIYGYLVKRCRHPKLLFFQRPERFAAALLDGSDYKAFLYTGEDFGCINCTPIGDD